MGRACRFGKGSRNPASVGMPVYKGITRQIVVALRHVLPRGMRAIRYYGYCHPSAKRTRIRIAFHTGCALDQIVAAIKANTQTYLLGAHDNDQLTQLLAPGTPLCPCCERPMRRVASMPPQAMPKPRENRGPRPGRAIRLAAAAPPPPV